MHALDTSMHLNTSIEPGHKRMQEPKDKRTPLSLKRTYKEKAPYAARLQRTGLARSVVPPDGIEPSAFRSGGERSIH